MKPRALKPIGTVSGMKLRSILPIPVPDPTEYQIRGSEKRVCTFDTETDPFAPGRIPEAFCCGFYDGEEYYDFWGDDCIEQFIEHLGKYEPGSLCIYSHNLPFDFR